MRIMHTSDWHLGKNLEGFSRLEEQEKFLNEFIEIVEKNNVDMVIIAGDIYDSGNPPAAAERLFYKALKDISDGGRRSILVIAGNHDNPDRLVAASPLASDSGIILLGVPKSCPETGNYNGFNITASGEGFVEVEIKGERAVILTLPYPSEKRLNEIFTEEFDEEKKRMSYSERIGSLFETLSEKYREDTINLAVSHLYVSGGETSDSERSIEVGGSYAVDASMLPKKAQYIALGHLHRPQHIKCEDMEIRYAGSPIQYSKSEINYSKCAYLIDVKPQTKPVVSEIYLKNYKPIEVWKCASIQDAIEKCRENGERDIWVYLEIKTDRYIEQAEIKEMKDLRPGIIEIKPVIEGLDESAADFDDLNDRNIGEMFKEFYKKQRGVEPTDELLELFLKIAGEEEESHEAQEA
jgi:exonuclease SbcD